MKWEKLGQIFNFYESPFAKRFVSHAQSPQAIEFNDFIRVFFSTRILDIKNKFISIPQYVDFSKDFKSIINYSTQEIITKGELGCFDEHGIFPFSPTFIDGKLYAYTSGWTRRVSVDVDSGIGLAQSLDGGYTFTRLGQGPVLTASIYEPFLVIDAFVRKFENKYYMFYICGERWIKNNNNFPERVYKITYAVSDNGVDWQKSNKKIISNKIDENECQALPTVIKIDNCYHMYFCYRNMLDFRNNKSRGYRIGYAYSYDLINWVRDDAKCGIDLSQEGWDSEMMCYPNLFKMGENIFLLYNGNEFGKNGFGLAKLICDK